MVIALIASARYSGSSVRTETPRMHDGAVSAIKATERTLSAVFYHDNGTVRRNHERAYNRIVLDGSHTRRVRDANSSR